MLKRRVLLLAAASLLGAPLVFAGVSNAAPTATPTPAANSNGSLSNNYYSNAGGSPDGTVRIVNNSGAFKCANIYVSDADQEMRECCACPVSNNGTLILSVNSNLVSNPANGVATTNGSIALLSSNASSSGVCGDPAKAAPSPQLSAFETHPDEATGLLTEEEFQPLLGTQAAISSLRAECAAIELIGSGNGICSCGTGG